MAELTANELLLSPSQLADRLSDPHWVVLDVRHDLADLAKGQRLYAEGHIPGAIFLHIDDDLSAVKTGTNGRHPLPDRAAFAQRLAALGLDPNGRAVVYDDAGGNHALRLWWMLRWIGMAKVSLLDGGFPRWQQEGGPISTEVPTRAPVANRFKADADPMTCETAAVFASLGDPGLLRLDARAPERFRGEVEPLDPVAGHIPGAVNRFWKQNLQADGTFKPAAVLREEFSQLLAELPPSAVIHHCGSGVTACHNLFAMELAGLAGSRLYPGSWSEWVADPTRPVATGA